MVRDTRHDSVHIFGAICPARGVGAAIIMPAVNTEAMNEPLAEISTQIAAGAHCLLVCDAATVAALRTRIEPDGKRLGLSARQQIEQPRLGQLRRDARSLQTGMAVPGRRPSSHRFNRNKGLGVCQSLKLLV
jgi:hypothetical protein